MRTLEITTAIGCPMMCTYCPQDVLMGQYGDGKKVLSYDDFLTALFTVPKDVRIDFSGMCEPFINPRAVDMLRTAAYYGHKVAVFTTCVGLTDRDVRRLAELEFETFEIHTQDSKGYTVIPENIGNINELCHIIDLCKAKLNNVVVNDLTGVRLISRAGNVKHIETPPRKHGALKCTRGMDRFVLLPDGRLVLCCMDYGIEHVVGNLFEQDYQEILQGSAYAKVKRRMADDGYVICRYCEMSKNV